MENQLDYLQSIITKYNSLIWPKVRVKGSAMYRSTFGNMKWDDIVDASITPLAGGGFDVIVAFSSGRGFSIRMNKKKTSFKEAEIALATIGLTIKTYGDEVDPDECFFIINDGGITFSSDMIYPPTWVDDIAATIGVSRTEALTVMNSWAEGALLQLIETYGSELASDTMRVGDFDTLIEAMNCIIANGRYYFGSASFIARKIKEGKGSVNAGWRAC